MMFSSFSSFSNPFGLPRFLGGNPGAAIKVQSVKIHDIDTETGKAARHLKHLIKLNHAKHAILFNHQQFHNHAPHILGSAYLLKASPEHLDDIYESEARELDTWKDSPGEISTYDWRDFLGNREYERAFVDFFEDQLVLNGYDWKKVLCIYLLEGKEPLINSLICGLGHPLIHLGYAYELSSREVAMEALGLAATQYSFLHQYLDDPKYTKPSPYNTSSLLELLESVAADKRFHKGANSTEAIFRNHEDAILEYWNGWAISDPTQQFEHSQLLAAAILVAIYPLPHSGKRKRNYDFFFVHLLTTSHAVRIIIPFLPAKYHVSLVRQWWLFTLSTYIAQGRPRIDVAQNIAGYDLNGKDWAVIDRFAISGEHALDAHYVKALRALKEVASTWGEGQDRIYLKAACRFAEEFDGWGYGG